MKNSRTGLMIGVAYVSCIMMGCGMTPEQKAEQQEKQKQVEAEKKAAVEKAKKELEEKITLLKTKKTVNIRQDQKSIDFILEDGTIISIFSDSPISLR